MNEEKFIWEHKGFRKDPYTLPEGYFTGFPDRMMNRLNQQASAIHQEKLRVFKPWMAWVSSIAAILVIGWFGFHTFYIEPLQEVRFQENIALFVDFCGEELHEGQLAGFFEDNKIEVAQQTLTETDELVQIEPDLAEQYIYESVGF